MVAAQPIQITSVPVGAQPLGVAVITLQTQMLNSVSYAVVANSGDSSLSIYPFQGNLPTTTVPEIPDPHAVIENCGRQVSLLPGVIVTSPSDNSVSFVQFPSGTISSPSILKIPVGKQPVSAACFPDVNPDGTLSDTGVVVVSNYGDQSLTLLDVNSHAVIATVPNVPGSPGLHGVGGALGTTAWIAGTDANLLTLLEFRSARVLSQIPVDQPVAIQGNQVATASAVLSFDPKTLQSSTVLPFPGIQLLQSIQEVGLGTGTFGLINNLGTTSLALFSGNDMLAVPQVASPQDMAVEVSRFCSPSGFSCSFNGAYPVITSKDTNSLIILTPPPGIHADFNLVSAAAGGGLAPGGLGSVFVSSGAAGAFTAEPPALPTTLGNVTLTIGGSVVLTPSGWVYVPASEMKIPLLYVDPNQINFQVPPGYQPSTSVARIERPDGTALNGLSVISSSAPAIFKLNGTSAGAVLNQDNTVNAPNNPAPRGSVIQIFATGAGDTTPLLAPGQAAPANGDPLIPVSVTPLVLIGTPKDQALNGPGELLFSGLAPGLPGVWQINARIPPNTTPGSQVSLSLYLLGSRTRSNTVTIAVN